MAKIDINTNVQAPDEIRINLVREDYLETSNNYRLFFEVCLAITGATTGNLISFDKVADVPVINWIFLAVMILGCIAFLTMYIRNYKKAKSKAIEE